MKAYVIDYSSNANNEHSLTSAGFIITRESENFRIWQNEQDSPDEQLPRLLASKGYQKIFENCFIPKERNSDLSHEAIRLLFTEISGLNYQSVITPHQNHACYEQLYFGAQTRNINRINRILDFGCGPGTILSCPSYNKAEALFGYDFVDQNLKIASKSGLKTLTLHELTRNQPHDFDLVVFCYVLHYQSIKYDMFVALYENLRPGGIWAANFHKSIGLSWFLENARSLPDHEIEIEPSTFGDLLFLKKVNSNVLL